MDSGLNSLLKWGIENSGTAITNGSADGQTGTPPTSRPFDSDALRALMGGPSDADLMKQAMSTLVSGSAEATLEAKLTAFDNFEQLIENLDNANNMEPLGLWPPLVDLLAHPEPEMRVMAAWCVGTAVQNNVRAQKYALGLAILPTLCRLALDDADRAVRRKAVYAISSEVRNYQPAMDEATRLLPKSIVGPDHISSTDMDAINAIMSKLREDE